MQIILLDIFGLYLSHVTFCSSVTCHILKILKKIAWKAASNFSNTASFLKLGPNPRVKIFEIELRRFWREDLSLTSKIKPCLKNWTPPYFCDMFYFRKVSLHHIFFLDTFIKKIIGLEQFLISFWPNLLVSIF